MARILYHSTHEPLEYDDINLFQSMGHTVFSLGIYCPANNTKPIYRPPIEYGADIKDLVNDFNKNGCKARFMDVQNLEMTAEFVNKFDVIISVQDPAFIIKFWDIIDGPKLIWRTVGQAIDHHDALLLEYRKRGLFIVRWSDRESFAPVYIGHDAVIRAYKGSAQYGPWTGVRRNIITLSDSYKDRYPIEWGLFNRVTHLLETAIVGGGNDGLPNSIGLLETENLKQTMNNAGAYFYMHGSVVPYTLNFIEAMMTGIPIVAAARNVEIHGIDLKYNEINDFIIHEKNGFLFKSEKQARGILMNLLVDQPYANMIGAAGRETAIRLFGRQRIAADWTLFFAAIGCSTPTPTKIPSAVKTINGSSAASNFVDKAKRAFRLR